jgi:hypothetical protein
MMGSMLFESRMDALGNAIGIVVDRKWVSLSPSSRCSRHLGPPFMQGNDDHHLRPARRSNLIKALSIYMHRGQRPCQECGNVAGTSPYNVRPMGQLR